MDPRLAKKATDPGTFVQCVQCFVSSPQFKVTDVASQELLGYFLMDLFPREGKYSHFCNIPMQVGASSNCPSFG